MGYDISVAYFRDQVLVHRSILEPIELEGLELKVLLVLLALVLLATPSPAAVRCNPVDAASRVLSSSNPSDLHPSWQGTSYIGLDWSVVPSGTADRLGLAFLEGSLYSPRGGFQGSVFILAREWVCREV